EIAHPSGRFEYQIFRCQPLFNPMPRLLPANSDATIEHEISILDRVLIAAYCDTSGEMNHLHAVPVQRRAIAADIGKAAYTGAPYRPLRCITHNMAGGAPPPPARPPPLAGAGLARRGRATTPAAARRLA